jgi:MerR family transcriptional regulator, repressor of the yfmOP operon
MSTETTPESPTLRIGEVAKLVGTTTRTIRYYEEIGLLTGGGEEREAGRHRLYADADVERLREALRLKALLGVSLDELKELLEAEEARSVLREEWRHGNPGRDRRREILDQALGHVERQLDLLARRRAEIAKLEVELQERRASLRERLDEQG